ncbi:hypothetical protein BJP08_09620 [Corynebacterium sp. NML140438]|uniref:DUF6457 domain-containing protein n=1 Tax=Corynebacterium sp. NML140438 TaxID=1906334 RepID=UPI0008FB6624|nr:DUF6457 domain-containing protein [Corynebacterium sp. NML140438]OIR40955.1 hypothetical protein BJP08_09620 [Corynebacterium sp. NML140438]
MANNEGLQSTHEWLDEVSRELNVSPELTRTLVGDILKMTADVAHNGPSRPAAPTTAFVVGVATGAALKGDEAVDAATTREALAKVAKLLETYEQN